MIKGIFSQFGYSIVKNISKSDIFFSNQKKLIHTNNEPTIFDVGAYKGETVLAYNNLFNSSCKIYAFEPFIEVFQELENRTADYNNINIYNYALGNRKGSVTFHVNNFHATNSILPTDIRANKTWKEGLMETQEKIEIPMLAIDDFVKENNIDVIDILKLDTQGSEHLVLEGAKNSISKGMIKLICAEIIVMPTYEGQKDLHEILEMYNNLGFQLYDLSKSYTPNGRLRFLDGIFIYEKH